MDPQSTVSRTSDSDLFATFVPTIFEGMEVNLSGQSMKYDSENCSAYDPGAIYDSSFIPN